MDQPASLFFPAAAQCLISLPANNLTYRHSDVGPEGATWPGPALCLPSRGLWMLDPSHDLQSWGLLAFSLEGRLLWKKSLAQPLALANPREFIPCSLGVDSLGQLSLVASRRLDALRQKQRDFVVATFAANGEFAGLRDLPSSFNYLGRSTVLGDGSILNLEGNGTPSAWIVYSPGKQPKRVANRNGALTTAPLWMGTNRAAQIEAMPKGQARVLRQEIDPQKGTWALSGLEGSSVGGEATFFGFIETLPAKQSPETAGKFENERWLNAAYWNPNRGVGLPLARVRLESAYTTLKQPERLVFYRSESVFDSEGNLFELAWTPAALSVKKYRLNRERADSLIPR